MEEKLQQVVEQIKSVMGDDANYLFVMTDNKDLGITALQGDPANIGRNLFYLIHQGIEPLSNNVYLLLKSIVLNMVQNKTELAKDLMREVTLEIAAQNGKQV